MNHQSTETPVFVPLELVAHRPAYGLLSLLELICILDLLNVPDAVISHMPGTRALDGRQEAAWDGFKATWTYHPSSGVNIITREQS